MASRVLKPTCKYASAFHPVLPVRQGTALSAGAGPFPRVAELRLAERVNGSDPGCLATSAGGGLNCLERLLLAVQRLP